MSIKTQGTDLYAIDPDSGEIIDVGCVTSIDGLDSQIDQIETTCLNANVRTYESGLATPGTATFAINVDPKDPNHVRLHQIKVSGKTLQWAIGWSEQQGLAPTAEPAVGAEYEFDLPEGRTWLVFDGFMNSFPFSFAQNAVVTSTVGIQISGDPILIPAVTTP